MYKVLLCIEDSNGFSLPYYSVKNGEFYMCKQSSRHEDCYQVNIFSDNSKDILYIGLFFKKLFITKAEWRDRQINSIFEDA